MDSVVVVSIRPAQAAAMRHSLRHLFQVKAESLHRASEKVLDRPDAVSELLAHRDELLEIDALLQELGWRDHTTRETISLSGRRSLIREIVRSTLLDAIDPVHDLIDVSPTDEVDVPGIRHAIEHLLAVLSILEATEPVARV